MKLYQPVLFVGLGGTGCDIGAELERRMREEICGPDGNAFRRGRANESMLPYQLPSCVQFVYADMNQAELDRLPARVVPQPEYIPAAMLTASYVSRLVPDVGSYPELAVNLRLEAGRVVAGWLPPATPDEPKVNPLHRGAGQFPTIGRAALFGTFRDDDGIAPAIRDIQTAIGRLAGSGKDLSTLGGTQIRGVDVFVAFSVAGGTGAGIFYDYLHLISQALRQNTQLQVRIYPLVLMPSAFAEGLGGGRAAEFNAGRALLDLFNLVDQQNGADAERELRGAHDWRPLDPDEAVVTYPNGQRIVMPSGTVQTGFLFSRPAGATREDMHRSIVSLVLSLIGTEMQADDDRLGEHHQSFADSFVNEAAQRQAAAENGIGNRGVSTALVASLTVPIDELSGIVGARLLRTAVRQISAPLGGVESNRGPIEDFLVKAGVHPILRRSGGTFAEPEPGFGAKAITAALNDRREAMRLGIESLRALLARDVPQMAARFDPNAAARDMLGTLDIFRLQRVIFGHQALADQVDQGGVNGLLQRRRAAPPSPPGSSVAPPSVPYLKDRAFHRVQWNDEEVVAARNQQDAWFQWQTYTAWASVWDTYSAQWRRPLDQLQPELFALTRTLVEFERQDAEDFVRRSAELYRKRVGVSYLLPTVAGQMEQFYQQVVRRMSEQKARDGRVEPNSTEADLLTALVGAQVWAEAFQISVEQSPEQAVSYIRERVKTEVKRFLREPPPGEQPMLPRLHDLLVAAAGQGRPGAGPAIHQDYLTEFTGKLAGMLPANFAPQGSGPLKVLVNYPADAPSEVVTRFLRSSINLPAGPRVTEDYRPTNTESLSVVLFRTGMGVTEVEEVRDLLRRWAGALARPEPTDLLRWRQRTGYDFGYLATRERHRVAILHRILAALWNGRGTVIGRDTSPERVNVTLGGGVTMTLPLTPLGQASSWGSLLRAYELWALDDDDLHRRFCGQLMRELPAGLDGVPVRPDLLYVIVRDIAGSQVDLLDAMIAKQSSGLRSRATQMRSFWAETLPAALDQEFTGLEAPVARSMRSLELAVEADG